jgi:hypothetical protein
LMTDQMRAQGQIAFQFLKTRSSEGVGQTIYMRWNRTALRVEPPEDANKSRLTFRRGIQDTKSMVEKAKDSPINKGTVPKNKGDDIMSAFNT